jgi:uroporphyrinogen decarboxylase
MMMSRERILAAIDHTEPDRVPIDLGSTPSSSISAIAYGNLKKHLGITEGHTRIYDVVQQLAQPEDAILDRFHVDVVDLGRTFNTADSDWYDIVVSNGAPAQYPAWFHPRRESNGDWNGLAQDGTPIAKMPAGAAFFDQTFFPWVDGYPDASAMKKLLPDAMNKVLWSALVHSPWDHAGDADFWKTLRERTLALRASTDRAIMVVCGCNLFEWGTFLRRIDNFLMDVVADQANVERVLDALMELHLATLQKVCEAVGDIADVLRFGDDLGMDSGPFMRPAIYRALFKPRHAQLCDYVHRHSGMRTFLHTCGSIHDLMPDLIEAGYDVLNPIQTSCRNMDPARLKREFGRDVTFWGAGCDTRRVLNRATPVEVKAHVLERLEILAPGGGFVFNTVHNILPEVPPQNIVAMFEAVEEFNGAA